MTRLWRTASLIGLAVVVGSTPACSGKAGPAGERPKPVKATSAGSATHPSATTAALLAAKSSDEDFQQAVATLEAADVNADVEAALKAGDRRLFGIRADMLEAPGVEGDRRALPGGAYLVAVAGTSGTPGTRFQQRFQMLARLYAARYNALLLSRLSP
jgi:hypothetical protein